MKKKMLFIRDFRGFSGGHLKVYDYFRHALTNSQLETKIFFTNNSIFDSTNPWIQHTDTFASDLQKSDIYFLAGNDWNILDKKGFDVSKNLVINLIQGFSHVDKNNEKFRYLSRPAIRICVSPELANAVASLRETNGPVITIPNGIDLSFMQLSSHIICNKMVFISGLKFPTMAQEIASKLLQLGHSVDLEYEHIPRVPFLSRIQNSAISIFLPSRLEGFYLPALEAMALGSGVIVPDCMGNRSFCIDGYNCIMPAYNKKALLHEAIQLLADEGRLYQIVQAGFITASKFNLKLERSAFLEELKKYEIL